MILISPIYIILLIALLLLSTYHFNKRYVFILIVFMLLLGVFRGVNVGTDHAGYEMDFMRFITFDTARRYLFHQFEWGFLFLIKCFKLFSNDYALFSSLLFIPFWVGLMKFFKSTKVSIASALLLTYVFGFYFFGYSAMRQALAMSLILASLPLLMRGKYVTFALITFVISFLFHKSQILYELLIPIHILVCKKKVVIRKKYLVIGLVISYLSFFVGQNLFKDSMNSIAVFLGLSDYSAYIMGMNGDKVSGNLTSTLFSLLALLIIYFKKNLLCQFNFYVCILGVYLYNITSMMGTQSNRISYCFFIFVTVALPEIYEELKTNYRLFFKFSTITIGLIYFLKAFVINNVYAINPYYTLF